MDIKSYIESGILEEYVMGLASEQEVREVECLSSVYPEVQQELEAIRASVASYAAAFETAPLEGLKNKVLDKIDDFEAGENSRPEPEPLKVVHKTTPPVQPPASARTHPAIWVAAASVALFIIGSFFIVVLNNKLEDTEQQIASLQSNNTGIGESLQEYRDKIAQLEMKLGSSEEQLAILRNPANVVIPMKGVRENPDAYGALATIYWDGDSKEVFVNVSNMPAPPTEKQYQLWAIVDGKAVDAGVFEVGEEVVAIQKMKVIPRAEAFVVTLEKRGGVPVAEGNIWVAGDV